MPECAGDGGLDKASNRGRIPQLPMVRPAMRGGGKPSERRFICLARLAAAGTRDVHRFTLRIWEHIASHEPFLFRIDIARTTAFSDDCALLQL